MVRARKGVNFAYKEVRTNDDRGGVTVEKEVRHAIENASIHAAGACPDSRGRRGYGPDRPDLRRDRQPAMSRRAGLPVPRRAVQHPRPVREMYRRLRDLS